MKRCFVVAAFIVFALFEIGNKGYAVQKTDGIQAGLSIIEDLNQKAGEICSIEENRIREQENKKAEYISGIIADMSLEEKLSQMIILTNPKDITGKKIAKYRPGGVIYFSPDFKGKTKKQVKKRTKRLQKNANYPMFIAVDEEGGEVTRTKGLKENDLPEFQSARALWKEQDIKKVQTDTKEKIQFLKSMGINLNLAPVADVTDEKEAYMYERSSGNDGETVAAYVRTVLEVMEKENMCSCIKHFPGYGNNENTHVVYTVDKRRLSHYQESDFLPFLAGIEQGADMVMVSHIVMNAVDKKNPSSLSKKVHDLLRQELGFEGVIIADDLNMKAILSKMTIEKASAKAIIAGNDMIFSADYEASMKGMKQAVKDGKVSEAQIDESVTRIMEMKVKRKIITVP